MFGSIRDIAMFMLYLVLGYLILSNASEFGQTLDAVGTNWVRTLRVLQGR
jgi:hypothetical protein